MGNGGSTPSIPLLTFEDLLKQILYPWQQNFQGSAPFDVTVNTVGQALYIFQQYSGFGDVDRDPLPSPGSFKVTVTSNSDDQTWEGQYWVNEPMGEDNHQGVVGFTIDVDYISGDFSYNGSEYKVGTVIDPLGNMRTFGVAIPFSFSGNLQNTNYPPPTTPSLASASGSNKVKVTQTEVPCSNLLYNAASHIPRHTADYKIRFVNGTLHHHRVGCNRTSTNINVNCSKPKDGQDRCELKDSSSSGCDRKKRHSRKHR